jgi:translocator protein
MKTEINWRKALKLFASVAICLLAGAFGSIFTSMSIPDWYLTIAKPSFNPPNWVFGPVWTILYIMMGVSAFIIWKKGIDNPNVRFSLFVFLFQLSLNATWSVLFFGFRSPLAGLAGIILLWIAIVLTIYKFFKLSKTAGWLLIPYLLWVSFASVLNYTIWQLNR